MLEVYKKVRKYEIRIRKAVTQQMQGNMRSVFKGSGLEPDDIRVYTYGDDIRHINWNASGKGHGAYVTTFREEKDQTVFFLIDVSASLSVGRNRRTKLDVAREVCGAMAISALKEGSSVGVLAFSDQIEKFIKPNTGEKHGYALIKQLYTHTNLSSKTDLNEGFKKVLALLKRKALIIVLSDFMDDAYEDRLKNIAHKHDLIAIHLSDPKETNLPGLGIIPVMDKESNRIMWVNSSKPSFIKKYRSWTTGNAQKVAELCKRNRASFISLSTEEDFVPNLIRLFKVRNRK